MAGLPRAWASKVAFAFLISFAFTLLAWGGGLGVDQALFAYGGNVLRHGGTLYLDLWDNKQPGVYWLYAAAQAGFGDGWPGIRAGYSLWLATAGAIAAALVLLAQPRSRAFLLAPAFTAGLATLRTDSAHLARVEALVCLPLAALLLLVVIEPGERVASSARWLAAGAAVAAVAALKLVLLPVPLSILALGLLGRREDRGGGAASGALLSAAGFALACAPVVLHFAARSAMPAFLWTSFTYPRLALVQTELAPLPRLVDSSSWLLKTCGLLLPAAALGAAAARRPFADRGSLVALGATAWLATAAGAILVQRFSWWVYHVDMLIWPIGILAAIGAAGAVSGGDGARPALARAAALVAIASVGFHGAHFAWKAWYSPDWLVLARERESTAAARKVAGAAAKPCGTVYAIGDLAGAQFATGLRQAIPMHGIFLGAFLPAQVEGLPAQLERARPDLVYVDGFHREFLARRHPAVLAWLDAWLARDYAGRGEDAVGGAWWERRPGATGECPAPWRFEVPGP